MNSKAMGLKIPDENGLWRFYVGTGPPRPKSNPGPQIFATNNAMMRRIRSHCNHRWLKNDLAVLPLIPSIKSSRIKDEGGVN